MTTPNDLLAEAERLDREATPGPWKSSGCQVMTEETAMIVADTYGNRPQDIADAAFLARARALVPTLTRRAREQEETIRQLRLALAEEQARTANLRASLEAVRGALGDAAGQTGTLAEDVAGLVNVVESVRDASDRRPPALVHRFLDLLGTASEEELAIFRETPEAARLRALLAGRKEG